MFGRASVLTILSAFVLQSGLYTPIDANSPDICPQRVRSHVRDGVQTGLKVTYVGDCHADGPYAYGCDGKGSCGAPGITFEIFSETRYRWTNTGHAFTAVFERKPDGR
jgi:hypothetical protein